MSDIKWIGLHFHFSFNLFNKFKLFFQYVLLINTPIVYKVSVNICTKWRLTGVICEDRPVDVSPAWYTNKNWNWNVIVSGGLALTGNSEEDLYWPWDALVTFTHCATCNVTGVSITASSKVLSNKDFNERSRNEVLLQIVHSKWREISVVENNTLVNAHILCRFLLLLKGGLKQ